MVKRESASVVTRMDFAASAEQVWGGLMFYEQIDEAPPLLLRLLLPLPIRTTGSKASVGDEVMCHYESGHLLKRVTRVEPCRHYDFDVVEQNLVVGSGLTLSGGGYVLRPLSERRTEVAITTRYARGGRQGSLRGRIETIVCHLFHRHLLRAMKRKVESR